MAPEPLYRAAHLSAAYQLRYGWTGWPSNERFPTDFLAATLPAIAPEWEQDGLRVLESAHTSEQLQLTLSATPQIDPVTLAARVKGRIQHHCRKRGSAPSFSRKVGVRTLGDPTRAQVEAYIQGQITRHDVADARFREGLQRLMVVRPEIDLSLPTETNSGRYWYNLHLVFVGSERFRIGELATLGKVRDGILRICEKKGYGLSTAAVLPDHVHLALRGSIGQSPETIALSFLNNLAFVLGQRLLWEAGYYAGTFGEYGMAAVR
jgi:REP element-mobilizing transposase RayT